jgi:predicted DNA-binding protein YlxM (UPF0122 family)
MTRKQAQTSKSEYPTEAAYVLAEKNDATVRAVIKGIRKPERVTEYIEAELWLADHEDRQVRKQLISLLNEKRSDIVD